MKTLPVPEHHLTLLNIFKQCRLIPLSTKHFHMILFNMSISISGYMLSMKLSKHINEIWFAVLSQTETLGNLNISKFMYIICDSCPFAKNWHEILIAKNWYESWSFKKLILCKLTFIQKSNNLFVLRGKCLSRATAVRSGISTLSIYMVLVVVKSRLWRAVMQKIKKR